MQTGKRREHTLSVLVQNQPGVLSRVAGMFSRRAFNIESIVVGATDDPLYSRMTLVIIGDEAEVEQVSKQLHKLIEVIRISELVPGEMVERELALVKVNADRNNRSEILQLIHVFRANIVDVGERSMIVEVTGDPQKVAAMIELLRPFGIREVVRTGRVGVNRGSRPGGPAEEQTLAVV